MKIPDIPVLVRVVGPVLFQQIFGAPASFPSARFRSSMDFDQALAAYEAEPAVRIIFESGGGANGSAVGAPEGAFELSLPSWPPPETVAERWYFHADGSLRRFTPSEPNAASSFRNDDAKGGETYDVNDPFEKALPKIEWLSEEPGRQVSFATEPLADDLVLLGSASADLWIQSTASTRTSRSWSPRSGRTGSRPT